MGLPDAKELAVMDDFRPRGLTCSACFSEETEGVVALQFDPSGSAGIQVRLCPKCLELLEGKIGAFLPGGGAVKRLADLVSVVRRLLDGGDVPPWVEEVLEEALERAKA